MMQRLQEAIFSKKAPIVVGLDPQLSFIPKRILEPCLKEFGETPEAAAEAFYRFNVEIVDAVSDLVPAVKPQIAMYEILGIPGLICYEKTIQLCKKNGLLVIGDIKRGDIGSTSLAYAEGHLGSIMVGNTRCRGFDADFATVNPYLGSDGVQPFIDICKREDKGIFVLVKTSNPSSGELQDKLTEGRPLYELVGSYVEEWGKQLRKGDLSEVGAVVGATYPEMGKTLREIMPHTMILVPGYGAQGGSGKDLVPFFRKDGSGAIVNSSRGIIAAWKKGLYGDPEKEEVKEAARGAVLEMKEDIASALS